MLRVRCVLHAYMYIKVIYIFLTRQIRRATITLWVGQGQNLTRMPMRGPCLWPMHLCNPNTIHVHIYPVSPTVLGVGLGASSQYCSLALLRALVCERAAVSASAARLVDPRGSPVSDHAPAPPPPPYTHTHRRKAVRKPENDCRKAGVFPDCCFAIDEVLLSLCLRLSACVPVCLLVSLSVVNSGPFIKKIPHHKQIINIFLFREVKDSVMFPF
jgi:hypothetical protein